MYLVEEFYFLLIFSSDLVGLNIIDKLQKSYMPNRIGLYRDDGLAIIRYINNQNLENMIK